MSTSRFRCCKLCDFAPVRELVGLKDSVSPKNVRSDLHRTGSTQADGTNAIVILEGVESGITKESRVAIEDEYS